MQIYIRPFKKRNIDQLNILRHNYQFYSNANVNSLNLRYSLICLNPGKIFEFRELNRTTRALNNKRNNYDLMLCRF